MIITKELDKTRTVQTLSLLFILMQISTMIQYLLAKPKDFAVCLQYQVGHLGQQSFETKISNFLTTADLRVLVLYIVNKSLSFYHVLCNLVIVVALVPYQILTWLSFHEKISRFLPKE